MPKKMCETHVKLQNAKKNIFFVLGNLSCNLHKFLGIIELRIEKKNVSLDKTVLLM